MQLQTTLQNTKMRLQQYQATSIFKQIFQNLTFFDANAANFSTEFPVYTNYDKALCAILCAYNLQIKNAPSLTMRVGHIYF